MQMPTPSKDKEKVRRGAIKMGRKILWLDDRGIWHASTDRASTPYYTVETEEV